MKNKIINTILVSILVVGLCLLLYPSVSNYINERNQSAIIKDYNAKTTSMTQVQFDEEIKRAQSYNNDLFQNQDAFYHPDSVDGYEDLLDVTGTGMIGYVTIDRLGVELPIYHGVEDEVLQFAAGHLPGTSLPIGGENTHAVLSGHRGLPSAKLFTDLDELEPGDTFHITVLNQTITYQVDKIVIVLPTEVNDLKIVEGMDYCTLMTCTPYGVNTHRLLVRGVRIENDQDLTGIMNEAFVIDPMIVMPIVATPMVVALVILTIYRSVKDKKRKRLKQKGLKIDEE